MVPLLLLSLSTLFARSSGILMADKLLSLDGEECDKEEVCSNVHRSIPLSIPVVFYGEKYNNVYMNSNGLLSFGAHQGGGFARGGFFARNKISYLAPLLSFVNNEGYCCRWNTTDSNTISDLGNFLEDEDNYTRFNPQLVMVASWKNVTNVFVENIVLTFQVILATDGNITYSKFLYHHTNVSINAFVGFYSGNNSQVHALAEGNVDFDPEQLNNITKPYRLDGQNAVICQVEDNDKEEWNCITPSTHSCDHTSYAQSCDPLICNEFASESEPYITTAIIPSSDNFTGSAIDMFASNSTMVISHTVATSESTMDSTGSDNEKDSFTTEVSRGYLSSQIVITIAFAGTTTVLLLFFLLLSFAICCLISKKRITSIKQKRAVGYYFGMKFDSGTNIDHVLSPTYRCFKRNSVTSIVTTIEEFKPELSKRKTSSSIEFRYTKRSSDTVLVPVPESAPENAIVLSTDKSNGSSSGRDIPSTVGTVLNSHQQNIVMQDSGIEICNDDGASFSYILPNKIDSGDSSNYYTSRNDKSNPMPTFSLDMEEDSSSPYIQTDSIIEDNAFLSRDRKECEFNIFEMSIPDDAVFSS